MRHRRNTNTQDKKGTTKRSDRNTKRERSKRDLATYLGIMKEKGGLRGRGEGKGKGGFFKKCFVFVLFHVVLDYNLN